jgi:L-asparaginase
MSLRLIATGGTFDKRYDPIAGTLGFGDTQLEALLRRARVAGPVTLEPLMQIDSLEMTDAHRARVLEACQASAEERIVIVHGTDRMVQTAQTLAQARLARCIVLTGALVPHAIEDSDALFNLGFALGCARTLGHGVWIAMNARVHAWDRVRKNPATGVFEPTGHAG